ncbi:MAG: hypothetical protein HOG89_00885 [Candidatus Peribacter sp.]|jgi:hypothetical protein|nr:hypothetical protein [Candidatus Peribacter sp.]MBT4392923.1 hypothetical protein [Candidatus Peribacter sp.]MBT4600983.1 hypothetical protein [Candidatus Peribacter sp.]MBT5149025.1 hypothetical protein [Candidatus Peribacter sp.]MBT5637349.1 hypothetical protein [Candidatus Peribacter sp.]
MTCALLLAGLLLNAPKAYALISAGREGATYVAGDLGGVVTGGFGDIAAFIAYNTLPFVNGVAILVIMIAGLLAVVAQDENRIANARKVIGMSLIGIVMINIANRIRIGYMTAFNFDGGANPVGGAQIIGREVQGFIQFAETPAAVIAILTIFSYGLKALIDYGGEQGQQAFRKAVMSVLMGILILTIKFILTGAILSGNPEGIINPAVGVIFTIVFFVALIAVVVIAIAGIYLIINLGDESRAEKAKKIIISVLIGLIFMLVISGLLSILIDGIF